MPYGGRIPPHTSWPIYSDDESASFFQKEHHPGQHQKGFGAPAEAPPPPRGAIVATTGKLWRRDLWNAWAGTGPINKTAPSSWLWRKARLGGCELNHLHRCLIVVPFPPSTPLPRTHPCLPHSPHKFVAIQTALKVWNFLSRWRVWKVLSNHTAVFFFPRRPQEGK